ncbi:MAG: sugar-binding transcriptional regulator [Actinobacteria bacterium]|nr:sugar-binding transcriptional regulator [Actinomycetota bacterium]
MNDNLLKVKVSKLYYQQNLSKVEISKNLRISRFKVAQILEEAVEEGIVTINIQEPENTYIDLENKLEEKFKIFRVSVVDTSSDYGITKRNIGKAAANCLKDIVYDGDTIGIAWGTTIYEMVNSLPAKIERKDISVVQLTGGLNQVEARYNAIELSSRLAKVFSCSCYQLYAPAIVDGVQTKSLLFEDSSIKRTLDMFGNVNIAIVGIGSVSPRPSTLLYREGFLKEKDIKNIIGDCAVGDINTYFYDINGNTCKSDLEDRTVGMNIEQLKRIRYVIGVAGGGFKANAIYAALKGKIINVLVTDHNTAETLLEK